MKISERIASVAASITASPLAAIAAQLHRLNRNLERYFESQRIPELPSEAAIDAASAERSIGDVRDEWEIAIEEEKQRQLAGERS